jgi:hypothetical protein
MVDTPRKRANRTTSSGLDFRSMPSVITRPTFGIASRSPGSIPLSISIVTAPSGSRNPSPTRTISHSACPGLRLEPIDDARRLPRPMPHRCRLAHRPAWPPAQLARIWELAPRTLPGQLQPAAIAGPVAHLAGDLPMAPLDRAIVRGPIRQPHRETLALQSHHGTRSPGKRHR